MASSRTTFEKLQRDRAKAAKAVAKREKRLERKVQAAAEDVTPVNPSELVPAKEKLDAGELLATVERLHKSYANDEISFEEFEEAKAELMAMIQVN